MKKPQKTFSAAALGSSLLGAALVFSLVGCYSAPQENHRGYNRPVQTRVVVQDDYVYYPDYEVYYNSTRGLYVYYEGNVWVNRREPPRYWVRSAPSVRLEFHDAPERHHSEIVRTYPRRGNSPKDDGRHDNRRDKDDDRRDRDRDDRR